MKKIVGAKLVLEDKILTGYGIVFDKQIIKIDREELLSSYECETIRTSGYVSAGFIDIHIHGAGSYDFMDDREEAIEAIAKEVVKYGTTSLLATTMTMDTNRIKKALDTVKNYKRKTGANVLGIHLEGPFLSRKYLGAQNGKYLIKATDELIKDHKDIIKIITLAPEEDDDFTLVKKWAGEGIVLSMGHTNATYQEAKEAVECGVHHVTHIFNAMRPLHHREPGALGAALMLDVSVELITDGYHIDPVLYDFVVRNKGVDNVVLVTDSIRATGLKDGIYELGGQRVMLTNGKCTLENGQLAGSVHTMNKAIKNMMDNTHLPLYDVVKMATINPARVIKEKKKGYLKEGYDADILILDENYNVKNVFVMGESVYLGEEI